jgi:uncharacterized protein (TIGR02001 family)
MKTKLLIITSLLAVSSTVNSAYANEFETSASATLVSQYLFRGFDLNQEDPALQGDFTFEHQSGFSGGIWGSTYDFGNDDGLELDFFLSYGIELSYDVSLSFGFTEYTFTGDSDASTEYNIGLSFGHFGVTYYDDQDLNVSYIELSTEFELSKSGSIALRAGRNDPDGSDSNNDFSISYNHNFSKASTGFVTYSSNDLDVEGAEDYFIVGITYSF